MKIKDGFVFQEIADDYIVVPVGETTNDVHGIIKLNETGAFLWKCMTENDLSFEELAELLVKKYSLGKEDAQKDVNNFIVKLNSFGCLEN